MRHDEAEILPGLYCRDLESLHEPVERSERKRRPANQVFGSFKSALDNVFWMTTLAITSPIGFLPCLQAFTLARNSTAPGRRRLRCSRSAKTISSVSRAPV